MVSWAPKKEKKTLQLDKKAEKPSSNGPKITEVNFFSLPKEGS